jgi:hypothetical protein
MTQACEEASQLRHEMATYSAEKDQQIDSLAKQFNAMRGDLLRIDGDIKTLTVAVTDISRALDVIAHNTTAITEMIQVYNNFKGFGFVMKNLGVILIGSSAFVTAVIFLTGVKIHIGA